MSRVDKGERKGYGDGGLNQMTDGVQLRKSSVHCGLTTPHPYTCHRAPQHPGAHLDVDRDTWFDEYKGKWVIMPRQDDGSKGARAYKRNMQTRKGM